MVATGINGSIADVGGETARPRRALPRLAAAADGRERGQREKSGSG